MELSVRRGARTRAGSALAAARRHPRHLVLAGLVAGLLLVWLSPPAVLAASAAAGAVGGRTRVGALAAAAVIAGALLASARLDALDAGRVAALKGRTVAAGAILLEPVR